MSKINMWLQDSGLFKNVNNNKYKPNAILSIIVFFCLWGGSLVLGRFMATPLIELLPNGTALWISIALSLRKVLICGFQIVIFFVWVRFMEKRKIITMGFASKHKAKAYFGSFFLGFGLITVITLILMVLGAIEISFNKLLPINLLVGSLCVAMFGWVVQSASEEIAIRGWLIPTLGIRYNPLIAVLLTGGVFGIIHLFGSGATFLSFINLILSGFFFALYAINSGNIWGVCGLHLGWNLALGNIYGFSISGEQSANSSLFISNITGSDILTGGNFGPEGGVITTVFLIFALLSIILITYKKTQSKFLNRANKH